MARLPDATGEPITFQDLANRRANMPDDSPDDQAARRAQVMQTLVEMLQRQGHEVKDAECFNYILTGPNTKLVVYFYPQDGLADWAITESERVAREVFEDAADGLKELDRQEAQRIIDIQVDTEFNAHVAALLSLFVVEGFLEKLISAFHEMNAEASQILRGILLTEARRANLPVASAAEAVQDLAKDMIADRKRFLKGTIAAYSSPHRWLLKSHYDVLLPIWKKARNIYENNKDLPTTN
jgi:plasmid stability protein